jgi:hypothetical protein
MKTIRYAIECKEYVSAHAWYRYGSYDTLEEAEAVMSKKLHETANVHAVRVLEVTMESVEIRKQTKQRPIDPKLLEDILSQDPLFTDGSDYVWRLSYVNAPNKVFKLIRKEGEMIVDFENAYLDGGDWLTVSDRFGNTRSFLVYTKEKFTE